MHPRDITQIAETELLFAIEDMKNCLTKEDLKNAKQHAEDALEAIYNSCMANLSSELSE